MNVLQRYARAVGMNTDAWRRHANPWSVWTRFATLPLLIVAIWSRAWIGWWALVPLAVLVTWLWLNPRAFGPVDTPTAWSSKGIFGEHLWVQDRSQMPAGFAVVQRFWMVGGFAGAGMLVWGLITFAIWPTVFGATLIVYGQLWRIDRLGIFFDQHVTRGDVAR